MNASAPPGGPGKHIVIVAHPEPASFTLSVANAYCAAAAKRGHHVLLRDLYRMGFDPVLKASERLPDEPFEPAPDVAAELALLAGASAFVLVYPIWFGTPPAILKGYVERVFGAGFIPSRLGARLGRPAHPLLGGRQLVSLSSSGSSRQWLAEQGASQSLQTIFEGYLARAFWMSSPRHVHFGSISDGMAEEVVQAHLREVERQATLICDRIENAAATGSGSASDAALD